MCVYLNLIYSVSIFHILTLSYFNGGVIYICILENICIFFFKIVLLLLCSRFFVMSRKINITCSSLKSCLLGELEPASGTIRLSLARNLVQISCSKRVALVDAVCAPFLWFQASRYYIFALSARFFLHPSIFRACVCCCWLCACFSEPLFKRVPLINHEYFCR